MDNFARDSGFISVHFSYECRSNRSIGTMKKGKGKRKKELPALSICISSIETFVCLERPCFGGK